MKKSPPETTNPHRSRGTALVTGATAGLGAEFCTQLAAQGHDLVIVARDESRLDEVAARLHAQFAVEVEVLAADLVTDEGTALVAARLALESNPGVTTGQQRRVRIARELCRQQPRRRARPPAHPHPDALVLMHAAINAMGARGGGRIINVASVAAFTPRGSYSAAKAMMVNFSRWANVFYAERGISVTALCPGFVHTEFHDRMGSDKSRIPAWGWLNAQNVVRQALGDSEAGKSLSIPSKRYKIAVALARFAPDALVERLARRGR